MTTANTIIRDAYFAARITDLVDGPDGNQGVHALRLLNRIIDDLSTEDIVVPYRTSEDFSITTSSASYTMGSGGTASSTRAKKILDCFIRDSSDYDRHIDIISERDYNRISNKSISAPPTKLFYDPVYPVGVIYFNHVPDQTYTAYIESLKTLHSDLSIATTISLPPEYENLLIKALSVELGVIYNSPNISALAAQLKIIKDSILSLNLSQRVPESELPFTKDTTTKGELFSD